KRHLLRHGYAGARIALASSRCLSLSHGRVLARYWQDGGLRAGPEGCGIPVQGLTVAEDGFYRGRGVLVCGGAGFLGAHLVGGLITAGAQVVVVDPCIEGTGGSAKNLADF